MNPISSRREHPAAPTNHAMTIAGIACCVALMLSLPRDTWLRLIVWLLLGFAVYFLYSRRHSHVAARRVATAPPVSPAVGD